MENQKSPKKDPDKSASKISKKKKRKNSTNPESHGSRGRNERPVERRGRY